MKVLSNELIQYTNLQFPRISYLREPEWNLVLEYPDADPEKMALRFSELLRRRLLKLTIAPLIGLDRVQLILECGHGRFILALYPLLYREERSLEISGAFVPARIIFKSTFEEFLSDLWISEIC